MRMIATAYGRMPTSMRALERGERFAGGAGVGGVLRLEGGAALVVLLPDLVARGSMALLGGPEGGVELLVDLLGGFYQALIDLSLGGGAFGGQGDEVAQGGALHVARRGHVSA